jgi:hypothetical protein
MQVCALPIAEKVCEEFGVLVSLEQQKFGDQGGSGLVFVHIIWDTIWMLCVSMRDAWFWRDAS